MASVVSTSNSNYVSSMLGSKNIVSGLASGLDTESMIEQAVSGFQAKLNSLQKQRTTYEWKQEGYRDIIQKMVDFNQKYTSFTSSTNLLSASFFNSAVKVMGTGENASKVAASGKTSSTVQVDSVSQLATAARYSVSAGQVSSNNNVASGSFDPSGSTDISTLQGTMTLGYGGKTVQLSFAKDEVFHTAQELADAINQKLEDKNISFDNGTQKKASELIRAEVSGDTLTLTEIGSGGNGVWVKSSSANIKENLGIETGGEHRQNQFDFDVAKAFETKNTADYLNEVGMSVTLDGVTKTIKGPTASEISSSGKSYIQLLQEEIDSQFGSGKLTVSDSDGVSSNGITLQFDAAGGSSFQVTSSAGKAFGMENGVSSFLNTGRKLGDLVTLTNDMRAKNEDGTYKVDDKGNDLYELKINGKVVGEFTADTALESVITKINGNADVGVNVNYSKTTDKFTFTAKQTGADQDVDFGATGLGNALFGGGTLTAGQNAQFTVMVNGESINMVRSTNTVDIDGLTMTLKGTFDNTSEAVTFTSQADSDKIVNAIKSMVDDYNTMVTEIRGAYSTMPLQKANGSAYDPLSEQDMADMSDTAIAAYEKKAKQGLLFGDSDLSTLYNGLRNAISALGASSTDMANIGLSTSYSNGQTTLSLDENKLRAALESDPDKVKDVFTKTKASGASSDGLMQGLKMQLDKYASTSGATKGILIQKAGSSLAPTSVLSNTWQTAIDTLDKQIERWQDKLAKQVDYYVGKFSKLEQLISQMNSQGSAMAGLLGGY